MAPRRNPLPVIIVDTADDPVTFGSGGTSSTDNAAFTAGASSGTPAMGLYESSPSAVTDGRAAVVGITSGRALKVNVENASVAVTGTFWQATQPVSLAAAVAVTDNSGSLTVDAPVGTPVFVRLSDGTNPIATLPVSLASVPSHAVTNAGTFVVQVDGTALTRLTDIETNTDSGAVVGNGAAATAQRVTLANDSTGILATVSTVSSVTQVRPPDIDVTGHTNYAKKYYTSAGAATDGIIWSPAFGKRWHVVSMFLITSAAATVTLEDDKAGGDEVVLKGEFAANTGYTINFGEKYPLASGEDAADLLVTTSAGNIYITCTGYEV